MQINVTIPNIFLHAPALEDLRKLNYEQFTEKNMKKQWYFSQNQKEFGCIVAAVLLILSSKELIWQKTRQLNLAITATILPEIIMTEKYWNQWLW